MNGICPSSTDHLRWYVVVFFVMFASVARAEDPSTTGIYSGLLEKAQHGTASWHAGTGRTASGERWVSEDFIAAHRSLPLGSKVRVINLKNGQSTVVRITDRGPYARGRVIDLSRAAARQIGLLETGIGKVRLETVSPGLTPRLPTSKPSA